MRPGMPRAMLGRLRNSDRGGSTADRQADGRRGDEHARG